MADKDKSVSQETEEIKKEESGKKQIDLFPYLTLLFMVSIAVGLFGVFKSIPEKTQKKTFDQYLKQLQPTPSIVRATPTPSVIYSESIYTFSDNGLKLLTKIKESQPNTYPLTSYDNNGNLYYTDSDKIIKLNLLTNTSQSFDAPVGTQSGLFFTAPNTLSLTTYPGNYSSSNYYVHELDLSTGNWDTVGPLDSVVYGTVRPLLELNSVKIFGAFGGDGCGGYGSITRVNPDGTTSKVLKTGGGCDIDPSYYGTVPEKNSVMLVKVDKWGYENNKTVLNYNRLYLFNPFTSEEDLVMDLKPISGQINDVIKIDDFAYILMNKKIIKVNLLDKSTQEIDLSESFPLTYTLSNWTEGNNIFFYGGESNTDSKYGLFSVDSTSGNIEEIKNSDLLQALKSLNYFGNLNGNPLFMSQN